MSELALDTQKLLYHIPILNRWQAKGDIYPIYVEISPSRTCNQCCVFCAYEYLDNKKIFLEEKRALAIIEELSALGVKSILYAGEGEPLLNPKTADFIRYTKENKMDVALSTNGSLLSKETSRKILGCLSWVRFSINGCDDESYRLIHRTSAKAFSLVMQNLENAVSVKEEKGLKTTIGVQLILLPENKDKILSFAKELKKIKVDYLAVKPFNKHPQIAFDIYDNFDYTSVVKQLKEIEKESTDNFSAVIRWRSFEKYDRRSYKRCLALPFFAEITSDGNVYGCGPYLGNEKFCYGNVYRRSFEQIWHSAKRKKVLKFVETLDATRCMPNCRLDEINRFLHRLKNKPDHVNFI